MGKVLAKIKNCIVAIYDPTNAKYIVITTAITVWDAKTNTKLYTIKNFKYPHFAQFTIDGSLFLAKNSLGDIAIFDSETGECTSKFKCKPNQQGSNAIFSKNSDYIIDGTWEGTIYAKEIKSGNVVFSKKFNGEMISEIHKSTNLDFIITEHHPIRTSELENTENPYFMLWEWPIWENEPQKISSPIDYFNHASFDSELARVSISDFIRKKLSVYSFPNMNLIWEINNTPSSSEIGSYWSPSGDILSHLSNEKFVFRNSKNGEIIDCIESDHPCHIAISNDDIAICGDWTKGFIYDLNQ